MVLEEDICVENLDFLLTFHNKGILYPGVSFAYLGICLLLYKTHCHYWNNNPQDLPTDLHRVSVLCGIRQKPNKDLR
jgi:hypothetical protein